MMVNTSLSSSTCSPPTVAHPTKDPPRQLYRQRRLHPNGLGHLKPPRSGNCYTGVCLYPGVRFRPFSTIDAKFCEGSIVAAIGREWWRTEQKTPFMDEFEALVDGVCSRIEKGEA